MRLIFRSKDLLIDIDSNGTVSCTPPALITLACRTDVGNFPFDEKHCTLTFGRWAVLSLCQKMYCLKGFLNYLKKNKLDVHKLGN